MSVDLNALRTADSDEAQRFFAEVDPEELVSAVAATSDAHLLDLIERDATRRAAVTGILARFREYTVADRIAGLDGVVRFDLERKGALLERHALRFSGATLTAVLDVGEDEPADVVLHTSILHLVRLVSGELNAGLAYLSGKLDIEGDADLALAVGGVFPVPGNGSVAVDPRLLDPVDVARALGEVPADHLRKVMRSGFRPIVLGEIFRRLPDFVNPERSRGVRLCVGFRLAGDPSGEVERYVVDLADGVVTVSGGEAGGVRDATVSCEGHDFLKLVTGHLNPVVGVLKGQLRVKGDRAKALRLASVMDIPTAG